MHHFADDTNLPFSSKNIGTIEFVVSHELKILVPWLRSNKLSLNECKTKRIVFRPPKTNSLRQPNIKIKNK